MVTVYVFPAVPPATQTVVVVASWVGLDRTIVASTPAGAILEIVQVEVVMVSAPSQSAHGHP